MEALSKSWVFRERALQRLHQRLTGVTLPAPEGAPGADGDALSELRSTAFLFQRFLNDQVSLLWQIVMYNHVCFY